MARGWRNREGGDRDVERSAAARGLAPGKRSLRGGYEDSDLADPALRGEQVPRATGEAGAGSPIPDVGSLAESGYSSLDQRSLRAAEQSGMGDLSGTRIHTGADADRAAGDVSARAFTVGQDVFFKGGEYAPGTAAGDQLLGHELSHVAQQRGTAPMMQTKLEVSTPGDSLEREADSAASTFARAAMGHAVSPASLSSAGQASIARTEATSQPETPTAFGYEAHSPPPAAPPTLTDEQIARAQAFNQTRRWPKEVWDAILRIVHAAAPKEDRAAIVAIAGYQASVGLPASGQVNPGTLRALGAAGDPTLAPYIERDRTLYLGANQDSSATELAKLEAFAGNGKVDGTALTGHESEAPSDVVAELAGLDERARKDISFVLESSPGLANVVRSLYRAEIGEVTYERVVLSGHSSGEGIFGSGVDINFADLEDLVSHFPRAAGQVEDLMVSGCMTGFKAGIPKYLQIFPNLRTIWAYAGYSPSLATGSLNHIRRWERATRGQADGQSVARERTSLAAKGGPREDAVAVWWRGQEETEGHYETSQEIGEKQDAVEAVTPMMQYFNDAMYESRINQAGLNQLYEGLQGLLGHFAGDMEQEIRDEIHKTMLVTLFLRHWDGITRNFMATYGHQVEAAYRDLGHPAPAFAGMNRAEVLAEIEAFPGDRQSEGYILMSEILGNLNPDRIPTHWNE